MSAAPTISSGRNGEAAYRAVARQLRAAILKDRYPEGTRLPTEAELADQYRLINEKSFRLIAVFTPSVKVVGNLTIGVVLLYGGSQVLHGDMTIGTFAAFLLYLRSFFDPVHELTHFFNSFQAATSALEKLAAVLTRRPAIEFAAAASRRSVRGTVALNDVHFGYLPGRPVLSGLSLTVPAGQRCLGSCLISCSAKLAAATEPQC